jgi:hypothetical protein
VLSALMMPMPALLRADRRLPAALWSSPTGQSTPAAVAPLEPYFPQRNEDEKSLASYGNVEMPPAEACH